MSEIINQQNELDRIKKANIAFLKKVAKMRELQKEYFKTRNHETLKQSKALETEVDNFLTRCFDAISKIEFDEKVEEVTRIFDATKC